MSEDLAGDLAGLYRQWFDALGEEGTGPLGSMLADEWTYTNYDGLVRAKSEYLEWVAGLEDPGVFVGPYDIELRRYGDIAVVLGGYRVMVPSGDALELRFTGVWIWRDSRWQCVIHHNSGGTA